MNNYSVFKGVSQETLSIIKDINQKKEPTFIIPTKYVSKEAAQMGYILNDLGNNFRQTLQENCKSFFCNSADEALQGAIKIIRHYGFKQYKKHQGRVVIYTNKKAVYQQLNSEICHYNSDLFPNIKIANTFAEITNYQNCNEILSVIFLVNDVKKIGIIEEYINNNLDDKVVIGLDLSMIEIDKIDKVKVKLSRVDVITWGEELTNREVPFGAFCVTDKIYSPWNSITNCLIHSSTYSGNLLSLKKSLSHILSSCKNSNKYNAIIEDINATYKSRKNNFAKYVNPKLIKLYEITGYDFDVVKAQGSYLTIKRGDKEYDVFDCVGGGGLSIFGHNPEDLVDVIRSHNVNIDYVSKLGLKLAQITGYNNFLPAVSGASAVESAMIMALTAQNKDKQKVLVFKGNYAGKLLLPLIGTKSVPDKFFHPIYNNVIVVDPFLKDSAQQIKSILENDNIGLVWLEYIRGFDGKKISSDIIEVINNNREKYGYYIGVDEILCGMCRTGPFMSIEETGLEPDITTLSKGLSYMTFPMGATLIKDELYNNALKKNEDIVCYLKTRYINQIGAHIGYHCLERVEKEMISKNVSIRSTQLEAQTKKKGAKEIDFIEQYGLYFNIIVRKPWWLKIGIMSEILKTLWLLKLVKKWLIEGGIFTFFDTRLFPRLNMDHAECADLGERIDKVTQGK